MKKIIIITIIFCILLSLQITSAYEFSLSPTQIHFIRNPEESTYSVFVDFVDNNAPDAVVKYGDIYSGEICIKSDSSIEVEIYAKGDLADYVSINNKIVNLPADERVCFDYEFTMPHTTKRPGLHDTRVGAVAHIGGGSGVGARSALEQQLWLNIPYPDKYIETSLLASVVNISEPVSFTLKLKCLGQKSVQATGSVKITNSSSDELVDELTVDPINIAVNKTEEVSLEWSTEAPGNYTATSTINYDGETVSSEARFELKAEEKEEFELNLTSWQFVVLLATAIILFAAMMGLGVKIMRKKRGD